MNENKNPGKERQGGVRKQRRRGLNVELRGSSHEGR